MDKVQALCGTWVDDRRPPSRYDVTLDRRNICCDVVTTRPGGKVVNTRALIGWRWGNVYFGQRYKLECSTSNADLLQELSWVNWRCPGDRFHWYRHNEHGQRGGAVSANDDPAESRPLSQGYSRPTTVVDGPAEPTQSSQGDCIVPPPIDVAAEPTPSSQGCCLRSPYNDHGPDYGMGGSDNMGYCVPSPCIDGAPNYGNVGYDNGESSFEGDGLQSGNEEQGGNAKGGFVGDGLQPGVSSRLATLAIGSHRYLPPGACGPLCTRPGDLKITSESEDSRGDTFDEDIHEPVDA